MKARCSKTYRILKGMVFSHYHHIGEKHVPASKSGFRRPLTVGVYSDPRKGEP